jgi:lipopolysaccharide/colanic/teichoic acid biosynthesis glycosyltransferase
LKRTFDFLCALLGLLALSPLLVLIAVAVWIEDRHSPFFLGRRMARQIEGSSAMRFSMVKFRTMVPDAWKTGVFSTANGDRRITCVGQWLRKAKLDELPQLWNVLVGDMSLVGPRPQVETDASLYTAVECRMLRVRPGITDLASIVFSDEGSILAGAADADLAYNQLIRPWKSRLALLYMDRGSVIGDVNVILLTLIGAVSREHALAGVEQLLWSWNADPLLLRMARRHEPLIAWPPPGSTEIVSSYPKANTNPPEQARTAATHG